MPLNSRDGCEGIDPAHLHAQAADRLVHDAILSPSPGESNMSNDCWEYSAVVEFDSKSWSWREREFRVTLQQNDGLDLDGATESCLVQHMFSGRACACCHAFL